MAIGASTGGPAAIRELLDEVPADAPVGFLIVQHIASGFELGFADWLNKELPFDVRLAQDGEVLRRGAVRLAPGGSHLRLEAGGRAAPRLRDARPARGHRPSVDEMFLSCAEHCPREVAGVLMTGMGADGVEGLLALRQAGGVTLVQDEASSRRLRHAARGPGAGRGRRRPAAARARPRAGPAVDEGEPR